MPALLNPIGVRFYSRMLTRLIAGDRESCVDLCMQLQDGIGGEGCRSAERHATAERELQWRRSSYSCYCAVTLGIGRIAHLVMVRCNALERLFDTRTYLELLRQPRRPVA
jgi:hypothetical protein